MIQAKFNENSNYTIAPGLWQYDYGQILQVSGTGITENIEIHFSTQEQGGEALVLIATYDDETDTLNAHIPGEFLAETYTEDYRIYAFIYVNDGESGETIYKIILPIKSRPKPEDYDDTGDEAFNQSLADAVQQVNSAKESVRAYAEEVQQSVSTAVQSAENASQSANSASQSASSAQQSAQTAQSIIDSLPSGLDELVSQVDSIENSVGDLSELDTQNKDNLVSAINEVANKTIEVDSELSTTSKNPVQNKIIKAESDRINGRIDGVINMVNTKADKTVATASANGLMSAEDKSHLDDVYEDYSSMLEALGVI